VSENQFRKDAPTSIIVNTATRRLHFYHRGQFYNTYPVAVGKHSTPTPTGNYNVVYKLVNPGGVYGSRWMGLNIPTGNYGIHGTNNPASIGHYVSLGCIRMHNRDIEKIFPLVPISTPVKIVSYESTAENIISKDNITSSENNINSTNNIHGTTGSTGIINDTAYDNGFGTEDYTQIAGNDAGTQIATGNDVSTNKTPGVTYTVQPGDTLWAISQRFNVPLEVLVQVNNIANPDLIYPGQKIIIPQQ